MTPIYDEQAASLEMLARNCQKMYHAVYLTPSAYAAHLGVSRQLVGQWLQADRLPNAFRVGRHWCIPADCPRPEKLRPGRKVRHENP